MKLNKIVFDKPIHDPVKDDVNVFNTRSSFEGPDYNIELIGNHVVITYKDQQPCVYPFVNAFGVKSINEPVIKPAVIKPVTKPSVKKKL